MDVKARKRNCREHKATNSGPVELCTTFGLLASEASPSASVLTRTKYSKLIWGICTSAPENNITKSKDVVTLEVRKPVFEANARQTDQTGTACQILLPLACIPENH